VTWFIKCVQKAADGQKQVEKVGIEESRNSLKDHAMRYFLLDPIGVEKLVP
jgi:hypothetical protein